MKDENELSGILGTDEGDVNVEDQKYKWIMLFNLDGKFIKRMDGKVPSQIINRMKFKGNRVYSGDFTAYGELFGVTLEMSPEPEDNIGYLLFTNDMNMADKMIKGKISPLDILDF